MSPESKKTIEEKLYANETRVDKTPHLEIADPSVCLECAAKPCTTVCPARTYTWSEEGQKISVSYENCLECGGCRAVCPRSVIAWRNPMGGMGICYRYG
ncbi:4Fe-4S dicluster domain-containing protein [bacterium]|nr:MAG: 4Fe-4S dicluster domain-containing protein [bacterium]